MRTVSTFDMISRNRITTTWEQMVFSDEITSGIVDFNFKLIVVVDRKLILEREGSFTK